MCPYPLQTQQTNKTKQEILLFCNFRFETSLLIGAIEQEDKIEPKANQAQTDIWIVCAVHKRLCIECDRIACSGYSVS